VCENIDPVLVWASFNYRLQKQKSARLALQPARRWFEIADPAQEPISTVIERLLRLRT
jgi:hypothetical protein